MGKMGGVLSSLTTQRAAEAAAAAVEAVGDEAAAAAAKTRSATNVASPAISLGSVVCAVVHEASAEEGAEALLLGAVEARVTIDTLQEGVIVHVAAVELGVGDLRDAAAYLRFEAAAETTASLLLRIAMLVVCLLMQTGTELLWRL